MANIETNRDAVDRLNGLVKISSKDWTDDIIESPELVPDHPNDDDRISS